MVNRIALVEPSLISHSPAVPVQRNPPVAAPPVNIAVPSVSILKAGRKTEDDTL